jgi:3-dehydroquinate dehydratase-1
MKIICPLIFHQSPAFFSALHQLEHSDADAVEIRLDAWLANHDLESALALLPESKKLRIYTIRTKEEGGETDCTQAQYVSWIHQLQKLDGLTDVQLARWNESFDAKKTVLSFHDFDKTPADLASIWQNMEKIAPAIEKLAVMPHSFSDVLRLQASSLAHQTSSEKIVIAMSALGLVSRLDPDRFESEYTFCSYGQGTAPGQVSLEEFGRWMAFSAKSRL